MWGKRWVCHKKRLCRGVRAWLLEKGVFDGARAVRSVFLTVRGRGAAQVRMRGRGREWLWNAKWAGSDFNLEGFYEYDDA